MKTNNGITLIALVVTIVVLLILAGVSISMLTGENGIITQAQQSKLQTEIGKEKEYITLSVSTIRGDKIAKGDTSEITSSELQTEMNKYTDEATVTGSGTLTVTYQSGRSYEVEQDGSITEKEELTPEEANKIVDMLDGNIGVTAGGKVVYIETELVMGEYTSMDTQNRTIITENGVRTSSINCFVDNEGKVYAWGDNLGNENSSVPICISDIDVEENALHGKNIVEVAGNSNTIMALDDEGKVYMWGDDGINASECISEIPGNIFNGKNIVEIQDSGSIMISIDSEGKIYTWGNNYDGQLGNGTDENSSEPICISDIEGNALKGKKIVKVHNEDSTTIALDNQGKVYTWGYNVFGQLGNGTEEEYSNEPICISDIEENVLNGKNIIGIQAGYTMIAIDNEGKVYAWGNNGRGQLGNGINEDSNMPICISDIKESILNGKNIIDFIKNEDTIIALDSEGRVYTWGSDMWGLLGDGSSTERNIPECITEKKESKLYNKNIKKMKFLSQSQYSYYSMLGYITEDGEIIYYIFDPIK